MREILFRGKSKHGEWYFGFYTEGYYLDGTPVSWIDVVDRKKKETDSPTVIPETVGQFTGLTDKNGKRIFEGDIVVCKQEICGNWIDCCMEFGFVEMKHGAFGLHRKQGYYRPFKDWLEDYEYEVLGNIHDNPELLGGDWE